MHFRRLIVLACAAAVPTLIVAATSLGQTSAAPSNTSLPSISGSARDGSLLQASHGSWTGSPTSYAYEWNRCDAQAGNCAAIAGATSDHYTVATADVGHRLKVQVTATNASGSGVAVSRPTGVVQPTGAAPKNTAPPTISGTTQAGNTLTVHPARGAERRRRASRTSGSDASGPAVAAQPSPAPPARPMCSRPRTWRTRSSPR